MVIAFVRHSGAYMHINLLTVPFRPDVSPAILEAKAGEKHILQRDGYSAKATVSNAWAEKQIRWAAV
jgi:hypothetical protein